ncbi:MULTISPECIES: DivIVA domain-containing protein [Thermoanaerobacterium]|jgi:cell division initiation protein|uniref:DivIVA domain n=1 Tax=Thermoanaerobacterium thermosaccharolyticum (strain ATCC 7956 / DSM 571 / NCIMB 9385 / NCA 3814 / NCTC 13789 / WDCM 00135 / 2032) TaxID=580327 RepID=D9TPQ6_THETC|nr:MULTISPECIES: DivIVA domain-containing protein [Thermoanaerobacterium]ADL68738.1 DivIVA domain [Thermoanaerobacterium thermosaccharolyticum DSM 571]KAA5805649.1 DivIVA domain-containing protein [Thermoanaerobacterium thermosaccharolyticum]WKV08857.1 DivIVA domain-containing protein [Thermoanaerobacterium sp. CMT5567-10]
MLTPMDIHNKEFKRSFRGYNENEVDEFLDKVMEDYELLYKENSDLKDRVNILNDKLQNYTDIEKTLNNTLVVAQKSAEDLKQNAKKEADLIIQQAHQEAEKIMQKANQEVVRIRTELENQKRKLNIFKAKFKALLEGELEAVLSIDDREFFDEEQDEKNDEE